MSSPPTQDAVQQLIKARTDSYGEAFNTLSADKMMSWQSQDIKFSDMAMNQYGMDYAATRNFFTGICEAMSSMKILESSTAGTTPEFIAWEILVEVTYAKDELSLGIKKGQSARLRGVALQWWRWEGGSERWDGDLSEKGVRGWKIVKENDYFVVLKNDR